MTRTRGRSAVSPAISLPTGAPVQRMVPSAASTNCSSLASPSRTARAPISPASAFWAAFCSALASEPPDDASATNRKPSSRPITWPSTTTSPVLLISGSRLAFSRSRRISTLVRRSTKRSVSRSCRASDSRSSTPRVTPCQCPDRPASPDGWRRKSRSGCARCAPTACRYRRRRGRPPPPGGRTSRYRWRRRAADSRTA